jgi:hypothetical protein
MNLNGYEDYSGSISLPWGIDISGSYGSSEGYNPYGYSPYGVNPYTGMPNTALGTNQGNLIWVIILIALAILMFKT